MGDVPGPSTAPYFMPRKATENFARLCQLIMTICSDLLRDVLSRYIKPADLRSELDNNRRKLEKIMNAAQKDLIYPASGSSAITAKDLDISVLYILLRNICNIPKHKNGWGKPPKKGDKSIAACIEKIKNERNLISGHSTAGAIEDNEFQNHWTELRDAIVEIEKCLTSGNLYERGVELLLSCDLNPQKSKEYEDEFKRIQGTVTDSQERIESLESSKARTENALVIKQEKIEDIQSFQRKTENELVIKQEKISYLEHSGQQMQAKMNNLEKNVKKSSGRKRKDQGYSKRKKIEDLEKRIKGLEEAIQNQNHHKKDEVDATTTFDNFNEDNWDEEDYYGDDDDEIDADTDDYGVIDEEICLIFSARTTTKKKMIMMTILLEIHLTFKT